MDIEKIIASIESTTKILDGKVVLDTAAVEELKATDAKSKELIEAAQAKTTELSKELEAVKAQINSLETDKVVAEAKMYVVAQEKAMADAELAKAKKEEERKANLASKGFTDEKIVATALSLDDKTYESFVSALEVAKAAVAPTAADKEKELAKTDLTKAKAEKAETNEMDLGLASGDIKQKMERLASAIATEIKK